MPMASGTGTCSAAGSSRAKTLEDCLVREVMEEGCARVVQSRYIGCQRVDDPEHLAGPWRYYQTRFWARVELLPWDRQHEVDERRLVRPEDFLRTLSWGSAPSAAIILEAGLKVEVGRRQR
jgi:NADH pyrophosphatase NudC (nudix superfamily)